MTNKEYANGLRLIADFFENNKDIRVPHNADQFNYYSANTREDAALLTRALGGKVKKEYEDDIFRLRKTFGPIEFIAVFYRRQICHAVVVGQRTVKEKIPATYTEVERVVDEVKWICDEPMLASEAFGD